MSRRVSHETRAGFYDGLNTDDPLVVKIDMADLARRVDSMNYGAHRFLSAWTAHRLRQDPADPLAVAVRALLDKGMY